MRGLEKADSLQKRALKYKVINGLGDETSTRKTRATLIEETKRSEND